MLEVEFLHELLALDSLAAAGSTNNEVELRGKAEDLLEILGGCLLFLTFGHVLPFDFVTITLIGNLLRLWMLFAFPFLINYNLKVWQLYLNC